MAETRELNFIISAVNKAEKTFKEVEGQVDGMRGKMNKIAPDLKKAAAIGVAAFGALSAVIIKSGLDIDKASSIIVKGTGASGKELENMVKSARNVSRVVPQSVDEVAIAVSELNTRMGLQGEVLEEATRLSVNFARVNNLEIGPSIQLMGRLFNSLEIDASEIPKILDKLTYAAQQTGISADRLISSIVEAGPAFEELGFDLDRSIALFSQFEKYGARPEEVISSLNLALNRLAREGFTDAEEAFNEYLNRIKEAPSLLEAVTVSSELFGSRVGAKVAEDIRAGRFEVDEFVASLQEADGTLERTANASMTVGDQIKILKSNVLDILAPTEEMRAQFAEVVNQITEWVRENEELIQSLVVGVGQAMEYAIKVIMKMIEWIGKLTQWLEDKIFSILTAGLRLREDWEKTKDFFRNIWESIKNIFGSAIDWIMDKLQPLLNAIERVRDLGAGIGQRVGGALETARGWLPFAEGGIVRRPTLGLLGEAGPEAVIPLNKMGAIGGITININGGYFLSETVAEDIGNQIIGKLKKTMKL
jgi:TP901 family phage tail tape measure protein